MEFSINHNAVLENTKCPVCREHLTIPVYQCNGGHSFCSVCTELQSSCSDCNTPIVTSLRNHTLERILENIHTACRFSGCRQQVSLANRLVHERECDYNPQMRCIYPECAWVGDGLIDHLKTNHNVKEFAMPKEGGVRGWNSKSWKNADWGYSIWRFGEDVILNRSFSDGETFYVYVYDLHGRYRVILSTIQVEYGAEFEIASASIRTQATGQMPFHISIAEAERFLLEPAHGLEPGYKRLSLNVKIIG